MNSVLKFSHLVPKRVFVLFEGSLSEAVKPTPFGLPQNFEKFRHPPCTIPPPPAGLDCGVPTSNRFSPHRADASTRKKMATRLLDLHFTTLGPVAQNVSSFLQ